MSEAAPNDTLAVWNAVTVNGVTVTGTLGAATDSDVFMVQVPAGATLTATLTPASSGNDFDLSGYDDHGSAVVVSQNGPGPTDAVALTNTDARTSPRYVRVRYHSGTTGAAGGYRLKLAW
jgi:serine protease